MVWVVPTLYDRSWCEEGRRWEPQTLELPWEGYDRLPHQLLPFLSTNTILAIPNIPQGLNSHGKWSCPATPRAFSDFVRLLVDPDLPETEMWEGCGSETDGCKNKVTLQCWSSSCQHQTNRFCTLINGNTSCCIEFFQFLLSTLWHKAQRPSSNFFYWEDHRFAMCCLVLVLFFVISSFLRVIFCKTM